MTARRFFASLVAALLVLSSALALYRARYRVTLTREEPNVYVDNNTALVVTTDWCTFLASRGNASLIWKAEYGQGNTGVFSQEEHLSERKEA